VFKWIRLLLPKESNARFLLKKGRKLIEKGWCQYTAREERKDGTTAYCASGALVAAAQKSLPWSIGPHTIEQAFRLLENETFRYDNKCIGLIAYNDKPGRSQGEVLSVYDAALKRV
jgi:hypothetical protein